MIKAGEQINVQDFIIQAVAGEALLTNDAVYIDPSDGQAYKCDATDLAKIGFAGFVEEGVALGITVNIKKFGFKGGFTGMTPNAIQYLSETNGELTETKPTNFKVVGRALTATTLEIITEPTVRVRTYTADDTWVKPAGLIKVFVQVQAGGGGSNGGRNHQHGGGGGGGYTEGFLYADVLSATEAVSVGDAGLGSIVGVSSATAGGPSSFGAHLVANGGGAGPTSNSGGSGGTIATAGDFSVIGEKGAIILNPSSGVRILEQGGRGHLTLPVPSTISSCQDCDFVGPTSRGYGYGGAQTGQDSQPSNMNGRDGGQGVVIVTEYY